MTHFPVVFRHTLRAALKRGALVAAANWPAALVQALADALFKLLIAVPLVGGIVLATLVLRTDANTASAADWRSLAAIIVTSLLSNRVVLTAFLVSLAVVLAGGSLFVFLVKGGTVGVLARGEREGGPIETPPLRPDVLSTAAVFSVDRFIESAQALFPRYARLGFLLLAVYLLSGAAYAAIVVTTGIVDSGWRAATLVTAVFVMWITVVNLMYLLAQVVIAADDCSVAVAARRVLLFLRQDGRLVAGIFVVMLAFVVLATGASVLAFGGLGLISLVPVMWLAAVPLQIVAVVLRAVVFQYLALASVAAYLTVYRQSQARIPMASGQPRHNPVWDATAPAVRPQGSRPE